MEFAALGIMVRDIIAKAKIVLILPLVRAALASSCRARGKFPSLVVLEDPIDY